VQFSQQSFGILERSYTDRHPICAHESITTV